MNRRITKHLLWNTPEGGIADSGMISKKALSVMALETVSPPSEEMQLTLDIFTAPRDRAIYFLHIGAEVEHALMVEYLYAAYSLKTESDDPVKHKSLQKWRGLILEIAREEMGHLVTVENILTLIGGPLCFEREDYPIPEDLYPFPFELEPLTKKSLGKYVLAEMPDEETLRKSGLVEEIDEIRKYVGDGGVMVNRVGILYAAIIKLFKSPTPQKDPPPEPPQFISSSDIQANSIKYQVVPAEWGLGYQDILIESATDRPSAIDALEKIATQGEGSDITSLADSHFGKFLEIYREFPFENEWQPSRNVATNPTTDSSAPPDRLISHKESRLWAGLLNLRYRMLLMFLTHSFQIETPAINTGRTPRGLLVSWAFGEMYNIRSLAEILVTLPLNDENEILAGPPFEMPYSLAMAERAANQWRLHRDLLTASQKYVTELLHVADNDRQKKYLLGLRSANESALAQVQTLIGG